MGQSCEKVVNGWGKCGEVGGTKYNLYWKKAKGVDMIDKDRLDEIRRRFQEALIQAKKDELRDRYGMLFDYQNPALSAEFENDWLDYILEFEQKFDQAKRITVREKIGYPPLQPLSNLSMDAVGPALTALLELLLTHAIVVDILGDVDAADLYRYLTEELLDEEVDDIHIEGMVSHFIYSTPENDVQMWVEEFVYNVFTQERKYFLPGLEKQPIFDDKGKPITAAMFKQKIETVWQHFPKTKHIDVRPITTYVEGDEATVTAAITWKDKVKQQIEQVESSFRLQPSPYTGWDVVQTSLLDDLLLLADS